MKTLGWLIVTALAECFLLFAWLWPTPKPGARVLVSAFTNYVPMVPELHLFGMFVAAPLTILAAYLLDREGAA